jgi:hypothetical protein
VRCSNPESLLPCTHSRGNQHSIYSIYRCKGTRSCAWSLVQ